MFELRHYLPILKGKGGEYGALQALETLPKSRLTPLVEVPPIPWDFENEAPAKSLDAHLKIVAPKLKRHWGTERPLFVDLIWIPSTETVKDGRHPFKYVLDEARRHSVPVIPVTGTSRDTSYQQAVKDAAATDGLGACIRLENDDFEDTAQLKNILKDLLNLLGISPKEADLILDFKEISEGQTSAVLIAARSVLNNFPTIKDWRNVVFAGSGFPLNLSQLISGTLNRRARTEWAIWAALASDKGKIARLPNFGDYAIAHPEPVEVDPRLMRMSANLRYTADNEWIILKGRNVRDYGYEQFNDLCRALVNLPEYRGPLYSWGDAYISGCAKNVEGPGNATTWRKVGTNHHLTLVTEQLATFPGI